MQRLLLLRHAKSDRSNADDEERDDHARPLNARGRIAAALMGRHMREAGYVPRLVLCSTSARTRETLEILLPEMEAEPEVRYEESLYLAKWPALLEAVRAAPARATPLLVVGHNPGMEQFALALNGRSKNAGRRALAEVMTQKFPTAALAVIDFRNDGWESLKPGGGRLVDFVRPKELAGELR